MSPDRVRELACYSANLVALRVMLGGSVRLPHLLRIRNDDTLEEWRSMVMLWKAGLDVGGMRSMLATVELSDSPRSISVSSGPRSTVLPKNYREQIAVDEILLARLIGDRVIEQRLRYGSDIMEIYINQNL
jgi:hypothetical protein